MTADLRTSYLGLQLSSPLVVSSNPLTGRLDTLQRLEEAGAAAVVLPSLFEEKLVREEFAVDDLLEIGSAISPEASSYLPELADYDVGPAAYLRVMEAAKSRLEIPVLGSVNGTSRGGWVKYARQLADAGADAIELNLYDVAARLDHTAQEVEHRHVDLVEAVKTEINVPLAVKISPYYSALGGMARRFAEAGADGLVLFNRFYEPDIDLETMEVRPSLALSSSEDVRLPLQWIAILHGRTAMSLGATTGVHKVEDVVKLILVGADVTMMAAALLQRGPMWVSVLRDGLVEWLDEHDCESVAQVRGSFSQLAVDDPDAYERANYVRVLDFGMRRYGRAASVT